MGKFCTNCGAPIEEGEVCRNCAAQISASNGGYDETGEPMTVKSFFVALKNQMGIGEPENDGVGLYERGMNIVPDCVKASEGEIPVKQYNLATLRTRWLFKRAEGRLQVTNKRLIFRSTGRSISGRITQQNEFAIDEIKGIQSARNFKFHFLDFLFGFIVAGLSASIIRLAITAMSLNAFGLVLGVLLGFAGLIPFFCVHKHFLLKLIPLGISVGAFGALMLSSAFFVVFYIISLIIMLADLLLFSFKPNLVISVKARNPLPAINIQKSGSGLGFAEVLSTPETESAIREIGAIISDIQELGDRGIEKWQSRY